MREIYIVAYECLYCGKKFMDKQKAHNHETNQCLDERSPHVKQLKKGKKA